MTGLELNAEARDAVEDGDKARFSAVVLPHLGDAYALARWLVGNRSDAEDVVQEASLRAFRSIATFNGGNARAWTLTIVRNTAYTWLSKNRSKVTYSLDQTGEAVHIQAGHEALDISANATPETDIIAKSDAAQLEAAILELPLEFREALVLRDLEGMDYREIARITGVPMGTVMSRLARARRRLIQKLTSDTK